MTYLASGLRLGLLSIEIRASKLLSIAKNMVVYPLN